MLNWINLQLENFTTDDIPDIIMEKSHAKVDAELTNLNVIEIPTEDDEYHFLKFACMSWVLNLLCKAGVISQTNGDILKEEFGKVSYQYQRANPLFFFAQGTSDPFQNLLPDETFRMMLYAFLRAYKKRLFMDEHERSVAIPKVVYDKTTRGYGWNWSIEDIEEADKSNGEYWREW